MKVFLPYKIPSKTALNLAAVRYVPGVASVMNDISPITQIHSTQRVVHPFLFGLTPLWFLFAHNLSELSLREGGVTRLLLPSFAILFCTWLALKTLQLLLGDRQKAGISVSLLLAIIFSYGHFYALLVEQAGIQIIFLAGGFSFGYNKLYLVGSVILLLMGCWSISAFSKHLPTVTNFLNIVASVLLFMSVGQIMVYETQRLLRPEHESDVFAETGLMPQESPLSPGVALPDIYYLIFDAYGGLETLRDEFDYDNRDFYEFLRKKGFYVADKSRSNYHYTVLSLASSLNFDYLQNLTDVAGTDSTDQTIAIELIKQNSAMRFLKSRGYKSIHFNTIYAPTAHNCNADWEVDCERGLIKDRFLKMYLGRTIFDPLVRRLSGTKAERIRCQFATLAEISTMKEPTFVFAHIIAPHEAYAIDAEGRDVPQAQQEHYQGIHRFEPEGRKLYIEQLKYINKKIEELIEVLLTDSTVKPIILLQADHGARIPPWTAPQKQWFDIFNASYWPDGIPSELYPSFSPVNMFRIMFNSYFQTSYDILPDRSYYSDIYKAPYQFTEVNVN